MGRVDIEVPNLAVDRNSWARSACYPRSSFYPISHGPSTRNRRITWPDFRLCSACWPCSQAPFCPYTRRTISIRPEGTFGRLRYSLGGNRPSKTARLARSPTYVGLEPKSRKSGISTSPPRNLAAPPHRLPPILHILDPRSMPRCSKASRGLFVPPRVARIFTGHAVSPSPPLRQFSGRSAFHAGRNLPDKGFRYLRTVRVTAAVHRGFSSSLRLRLSSPFNLPALGRRRPVYFGFPLSTGLCFS